MECKIHNSNDSEIELFLIRHTEVLNPEKICYGRIDIPLLPSYKNIAQDLKKKLDLDNFNHEVYSSNSIRCKKLATAIFPNKKEIKVLPSLNELNFGNWEGIKWSVIEKTPEFQEWVDDFDICQTPGGESYVELQFRAWNAIKNIINSSESTKIFIITHGGTIRSILSKILDLPLKKSFEIKIDYNSITKITYLQLNSRFFINYINTI